MSDQLRLRFKSAAGQSRGLPDLDAEQRVSLRDLPIELVKGIASLFRQPAPAITKPGVWPIIVADVLYLATTGWAADALLLGWRPVELFGCAATPAGDDTRLGLAGRLDGRDVVKVSQQAVLTRDGPASIVIRRNRSFANTTFLWDYGR